MTAPPFRDGVFRLFRLSMVEFVVRAITGAIVARIMGPADMGVWILLMLMPSYAEAFGRLKSDIAAVYVLSKGRWSLGEVCMALNVIALASSGVVVCALLVAEPWILETLFRGSDVHPLLYRLTLGTIPLHFVAMNYAYLLLHFEDVFAYNVQRFLRSVLPSLLAALLLLTTSGRLEVLVGALVTGSALGLIYSFLRIHKREWMSRPRQPGLYAALLTYGKQLYFSGLIEHLSLYLSSVLVGLRLAPSALAFFRMGQDRAQVLDQVPSAVNILLYPRLVKMDEAEARVELATKSCRILAIVLVGGGALGAALTPGLVRLLYGREYLSVIWSVWLLLPGVAMLGITSPVVQYFMGTGRPDYVWKLALIPLSIQAALLLKMMDLWSFHGAAIAVSISFCIAAYSRVFVMSRIVDRPMTDMVLPRSEDFRAVRTLVSERLGGVWRGFRRPPTRGAPR